MPDPTEHEPGEDLMVLERVVVAPALGVFRSVDTGTVVREGDPVGVVVGSGVEHPVLSRFDGYLMGVLAHEGERVREGEPVAWLRLAG